MIAVVQPGKRGFLMTLAVSAGGAVLSGAAAAIVVSLYPPGAERAHPALWGGVVLPVAVALVAAGALASGARGVFLNSLAFLLPQASGALAVFFLFAHPGGAGSPVPVLASAEFWGELAAAYALVAAFVGVEFALFRRARR